MPGIAVYVYAIACLAIHVATHIVTQYYSVCMIQAAVVIIQYNYICTEILCTCVLCTHFKYT